MKKLFILLTLLASLSSPARASISKVGGCAAATTSCTMPGNNVGDFIYAFAFRSATTAPTLPAGWTQIDTNSASNSSFRSGCKVATTTSETSGTWTNATSLTVEIYRGTNADRTATCATHNGIGGETKNTGTTSTITYGTITMTNANSTSWVIGASGSSAGTCTPTGMTSEQASTTVNILNDTNGTVNSWSSTNCTGTTGNWKSNVVEILAAAPTFSSTLVHARRDNNANESGNTFKYNYGGSKGTGTLSGNLLTVTFTFAHGITVSSITDNQSSTYSLAKSVDSGVGGWITSMYYVQNATAGINLITIVFSASSADFHIAAREFSGIATSTPLDVTCSSLTVTAPTVQCDSAMTTTANGDLILLSTIDTGGLGTTLGINSNGISPGYGFVMDSQDPNVISDAEEEFVQATSGAINPTIYVAQGSARAFNTLGAAFKTSGGAGTAPTGLYIAHQGKYQAGSATQTQPFVATGNFIGVSSDSPNTNTGGNVMTIDTCLPTNNTFTKRSGGSSSPQIFFSTGATTSTNGTCVVHSGNFSNSSLFTIYDLVNAGNLAEDVDATTGLSGSQGSAGADITDAPDVTPTSQPGFALGVIQLGNGPTSGAIGSGFVYDNTPYTGETDASKLNNGNGMQHIFYTSTSQLAFGWHTNNSPASSWAGYAVTFKNPSPASGSVCTFTLLGVGKC